MKLTNLIDWKWWCNLEEWGPAPAKSLTITITAHNEGKHVAGTIESVLRQTYNKIYPITLIAVNDGSSDNTGEVIDRYKDKGVITIHHEKASGRKAHAANSGLAITTTEYFLAMDGDSVLADDAIEQVMRRFTSPEIHMVAGVILAVNNGTFIEKARTAEYLYAFSVMKPAQSHVMGPFIASGGFSIVRTDTLRSFGGYSPRTIAEDFDLTLMMHEHKYKVRFAHNAVCSVVDPKKLTDYTNQLTRWNHGFIQNFKVRNFNMFKHNFWLGIMAYSYLIWNIIGPAFLPFIFFALIGNVVQALAMIGITWLAAVLVPVTIKAIQLKIPLTNVVYSAIPMFLSQYINAFMFLKVVCKELTGKTESGWRKSH